MGHSSKNAKAGTAAREKKPAARSCRPLRLFSYATQVTGVRRESRLRHGIRHHETRALHESCCAPPALREIRAPVHARSHAQHSHVQRSHVQRTKPGPTPGFRTTDGRATRSPSPIVLTTQDRGTTDPPPQTLHSQTNPAHSIRTARRHKDSIHSSRRCKPAPAPRQRRLDRPPLPPSLALANTSAEAPAPPAMPNISRISYSPPVWIPFFFSRRAPRSLPIPSTHWNRGGREKLQFSEWLISAILVKFNHLQANEPDGAVPEIETARTFFGRPIERYRRFPSGVFIPASAVFTASQNASTVPAQRTSCRRPGT